MTFKTRTVCIGVLGLSAVLSARGADAATKTTKRQATKTTQTTQAKAATSTLVAKAPAPTAPLVTSTVTKAGVALGTVVPILDRPITIMPLGDDQTSGGGLTGGQSYRGHLYNALKAGGYNVDFVGSQQSESIAGGDQDNEGHGAFTIGPDDSRYCNWPVGGQKDCQPTAFNIASNVDTWLAAAKPDIVLLQVGLYDLFEPTLKEGTDGIDRTFEPKKAPQHLADLVAQIRRSDPNVIVIVASLLKPNWVVKGWAPYDALNAQAVKLGEAAPDDRVLSINLSIMTFKKDEYLDGFHMTDAASQRVADQWKLVVQSALNKLLGRPV